MDSGSLDIKTVIELWKATHDQLNSYWNVYQIVAFAILGIIFGGGKLSNPKSLRWFFALSFFAFGLCHLLAISKQQAIIITIVDSLYKVNNRMVPIEFKPIIDSMKATPLYMMRSYHLLLDISISAFIFWALSNRAKKEFAGSIEPGA